MKKTIAAVLSFLTILAVSGTASAQDVVTFTRPGTVEQVYDQLAEKIVTLRMDPKKDKLYAIDRKQSSKADGKLITQDMKLGFLNIFDHAEIFVMKAGSNQVKVEVSYYVAKESWSGGGKERAIPEVNRKSSARLATELQNLDSVAEKQ